DQLPSGWTTGWKVNRVVLLRSAIVTVMVWPLVTPVVMPTISMPTLATLALTMLFAPKLTPAPGEAIATPLMVIVGGVGGGRIKIAGAGGGGSGLKIICGVGVDRLKLMGCSGAPKNKVGAPDPSAPILVGPCTLIVSRDCCTLFRSIIRASLFAASLIFPC